MIATKIGQTGQNYETVIVTDPSVCLMFLKTKSESPCEVFIEIAKWKRKFVTRRQVDTGKLLKMTSNEEGKQTLKLVICLNAVIFERSVRVLIHGGRKILKGVPFKIFFSNFNLILKFT